MPSPGELLDITGLICLFILFLFFSASLRFLSLWAQALALSFVLCVFILIFGLPSKNPALSLMLIVALWLFLYWGYSRRIRTELALRKRLNTKSHGVEWTRRGFVFRGVEYRAPLFIRGREDCFLAYFFISYPDDSKNLYPAVFYIQGNALIMAQPKDCPAPPGITLENNKSSIKIWKRYHAQFYSTAAQLANLPK